MEYAEFHLLLLWSLANYLQPTRLGTVGRQTLSARASTWTTTTLIRKAVGAFGTTLVASKVCLVAVPC